MEWISFGALPCKKTTWQLASRCFWNRAHHLTCFLSTSVTRKDLQFGTWTDPSFQRHCRFRPTTWGSRSAQPRSYNPKPTLLRSSSGCRTIDYTIFPLPLWHFTSSAHSPHPIRKRYRPSLSVLAAWYFLPQTQPRCNDLTDLTQIILYMQYPIKYPQN
jgi:hypothetical protein